MTRVLLTGATGFVGTALAEKIVREGVFDLSVTVRNQNQWPEFPNRFVVPELDGKASLERALNGVDIVIHTAARVHVMQESSNDPLADFRKVNVDGTLNLARQAAAIGVKRFIFLSSIKVNGEATRLGQPFKPDDNPAPMDFYGISKMEAENELLELAKTSEMDVVIIRPVLVYGPGVKANFFNMMQWVSKGYPLPLGGINNKRSLVALDNLLSLIITCITHPAASNQIFLVSDGEDLSTSQLLVRTSKALNKRSILVPLPSWFLRIAATVLGKRDVYDRLCGSLQVDISKTRKVLGWQPEISVDDALCKTAKHFEGASR